jgi:hypothetical protein
MADQELQAVIRAEISDFLSKMEQSAAAAARAAEETQRALEGMANRGQSSMVKLTRSMEVSADESKSAFAQINEAAESVKDTLEGLADVFLIGAAIELSHRLIEGAAGANELEVQLLHLSERTGVSVEQMNALAGVAKLADVPMDALARSMTMLARQMVLAEQGSKSAQAAFAAFGISVEELKGLNVHEVFLRVADAISQARDSTEKLGEASVLLGSRMGTQLLPVMKEGRAGILGLEAAYGELNPLTAQQAEEADKLHRSWEALKVSGDSLWRQLEAEAAPALIRVNRELAFLSVATLPALKLIPTLLAHPFSPDLWHKAAEDGRKTVQQMMGDIDKLVNFSTSVVGGPGNEVNVAKGGAAAAHKAAEEQFRAFVEEGQLEIAEAQNNAIVKIGIMMGVVEKAKQLFGEQSNEYRRALVGEQEAVNAFARQQQTFDAQQAAAFNRRLHAWTQYFSEQARLASDNYNRNLHQFTQFLAQEQRQHDEAINRMSGEAAGATMNVIEAAMMGGRRGARTRALEEVGVRMAEQFTNTLLSKAYGQLFNALFPQGQIQSLFETVWQNLAPTIQSIFSGALSILGDLLGGGGGGGGILGSLGGIGSIFTSALSLFGFAEGGPVTHTGMALVHAGEYVLSRADLSAASSMGAGIRASYSNSTTNNRGGDIHQIGPFHVTGSDVADIGPKVVRHIKEAIRSGDPQLTRMSRAGFPTGMLR